MRTWGMNEMTGQKNNPQLETLAASQKREEALEAQKNLIDMPSPCRSKPHVEGDYPKVRHGEPDSTMGIGWLKRRSPAYLTICGQ